MMKTMGGFAYLHPETGTGLDFVRVTGRDLDSGALRVRRLEQHGRHSAMLEPRGPEFIVPRERVAHMTPLHALEPRKLTMGEHWRTAGANFLAAFLKAVGR